MNIPYVQVPADARSGALNLRVSFDWKTKNPFLEAFIHSQIRQPPIPQISSTVKQSLSLVNCIQIWPP